MPASFWFDKRAFDTRNAGQSANGVPARVLEGLAGKIDGNASPTIWAFWKNPRLKDTAIEDPKKKDQLALFMRGTIEELQAALQSDIRQGIESLSVSKGQLAVWYIRQAASPEFIVCVAGRGDGLEYYWNMPDNKAPSELGPPETYWLELLKKPASILLRDLSEQLKKMRYKPGWYPDVPPRVITPAFEFSYNNVVSSERWEARSEHFTLLRNATQEFYVFKRTDRIQSTSDQSKWEYTGDKIHVSVSSAQIAGAWDLIFPILLEHRGTIQEFKLTKMEQVRRELPNERASRIYYGAQISIYLHAAPINEERDTSRFADAMKLVSQALKKAGIQPGIQPEADLWVTEFLTFRRDINDLVNPARTQALKQNWKEDEEAYRINPAIYINDESQEYSEHKKLMSRRLLYRVLLGVQ